MRRGRAALVCGLWIALPVAAQEATINEIKAALSDPDRVASTVDELVAHGSESAVLAAAAVSHGSPTAQRAGAMILRRLGPRANHARWRLMMALLSAPPERAPAILDALADIVAHRDDPLIRELHKRCETLVVEADPETATAIRKTFVRALTSVRERERIHQRTLSTVFANFAMQREFAATLVAEHPERFRKTASLLRERLAAEPAPTDRGRASAFGADVTVDDRFFAVLARAVERVDGRAPDSIHIHHWRLLHGDEPVRLEAVCVLGPVSKRPDVAVRALVDALDDPSRAVRLAALEQLVAWDAHAAPALDRLRTMPREDDPRVIGAARGARQRIAAAAALGEQR